MLSVIVCSRKKELDETFVKNIQNTIGVSYELISVDNSDNNFTIFTAYNVGYARSNYQYLCFLHEDVKFHSNNWGVNVIKHLNENNTGIIGVAGGDIVHRVPCAWSKVFTPSQNVLQTDLTGQNPPEHYLEPQNYSESKRTTITVDGIMLCMRKELMADVVRFDENLPGFHGYDYDISLQSNIAGYQNFVIYDIRIEHFSRGKTNQMYFNNLISIYKKYENQLPIIGKSITEENKMAIGWLERKNLNQLTKKMVRKGFEANEVKTEIIYFANIIGDYRAAKFFKTRVFLIRLFNCPRYIFKVFRNK
jgi:hypothetical protein